MPRFAALLICLFIFPASIAAEKPDMAVIVACHDGDTCRLDREILPGRAIVRIANIDAPELAGRCRAETLLAALARDAAAAHAGERVTLSRISPDKYRGRVDAVVTLADGRDLGRLLIDAGVALPWTGRRIDWCG